MRSERVKELTAVLSVLSVAITIGVTALTEIPVKSELFPRIAGLAVFLAATAAYVSIFWSRKLAHARDRKRIFLIYAREDLDKARWLSGALRERGFRPWLDVEEIVAGEVWKKSVLRALEESAVALVLVSEHIGKKGFVQEELKAALSTLQERRRDVSPVIPVRLTDSPVPEALGDIQWVNLFDPDGLERLENGLKRVTA